MNSNVIFSYKDFVILPLIRLSLPSKFCVSSTSDIINAKQMNELEKHRGEKY